MPKQCAECGFTPPVVEQEPPASPTGTMPEIEDPDVCLNCGKKTMQEVVAPEAGEEEEVQ